MKEKCCHEGHRHRLRTRYLDFGADSLFEHELLELILFCPIPRRNTNEIGHSLIDAFGNINGTFAASIDEITKVKDVGPGTAVFLKMLGDAVKDYGNSMSSQYIDDNIESYRDLFVDYFTDAADDLCLLISPASSQRITFFKNSALGSNEEFKSLSDRIIRNGWDRLVIGINHGDRFTSPDNGDLALIKRLSKRLSLLSIELIDCIIVNKRTSFSFRQNGAISF